jgi:hypothetical protein
MKEIKAGEIRYFTWSNEGSAKLGNLELPLVTLWTARKDGSVNELGACPEETAERAGWVKENPYS